MSTHCDWLRRISTLSPACFIVKPVLSTIESMIFALVRFILNEFLYRESAFLLVHICHSRRTKAGINSLALPTKKKIQRIRCGYFDLKINASIVAFNIADYTITNTFFFESLVFFTFRLWLWNLEGIKFFGCANEMCNF